MGKELRTKLKSAIAEQKGVDASTIDDIYVRKAQKRAAKLKVKKKRIAQKRAAANSGGRRRLSTAEENAELKNDIARMEGKPVEDVKDSEVEEDKMGGEDEAFEEIAEAVGKVVEEDATLDTKDKKKAKFKELRTKLKSAIAEQKGVDASTIDDIDVRKAQKRAAKLKVKKKRIAQKRAAANSGG